MHRMVWIICLLAVVALPGCSSASHSKKDDQAGLSNIELEQQVRSRLNGDQALKDSKLLVATDAAKQQVKVSGTVNSQDLRQKAIELAREAVPGATVIDAIQVRPEAQARADAPARREKPNARPSGRQTRNRR